MKSVELFSGAGGLALSLEAAGFDTVGLYEYNADACETLRRNRPTWNVLEGDIRDFPFDHKETVDLVAGGPPCQPFSVGGKAKGKNDKRDMFPEAVRAVRTLRPRAFLFENVRGLMRPAFANYVEYIRLQLTHPAFPVSANASWETNLRRLERHHTSTRPTKELTYNVSLHLADAADYGVPQRRHRVFFVGFRHDIDANWFFPSASHAFDELLRSQYISHDYWSEHDLRPPANTPSTLQRRVEKLRTPELFPSSVQRWQTVRDAIADLPAPGKTSAAPNHIQQPGARAYPGHTGSPIDLPSKALKAGDHGVPGGENMLRHPNGCVRYFTVRESARIQTFPDDYEFLGSWSECMRQLGNAVPVQLGYAVANSIAQSLKAANEKAQAVQSTR